MTFTSGAALYRIVERARDKVFVQLVRGSFGSFGARTIIQPPLRIAGEQRIRLGSSVFIGSNCWLQALDSADGSYGTPGPVLIELGDQVSLAGGCTISAVAHVRLGHQVLVARNVYISDHSHGFTDNHSPIVAQPLDRVAPVEIRDGAWLGQNSVVMPGVCIGRGTVIGANSVVTRSVPDRVVAVGAPAQVVRRL